MSNATSISLSVLYTKQIVGRKRKGKVNVKKSVQKAVRKYRLK